MHPSVPALGACLLLFNACSYFSSDRIEPVDKSEAICGVEPVPRHQNPETLLFWAKSGAKDDPRVWHELPYFLCNRQVVNANVTTMPNLKNDPALEPELVVEFGSSGEVIRRWPMPLDRTVGAICGNSIIIILSPVPEPGVVAFFITSDGSIETRYIPYPRYSKDPVTCPPFEAFEDTADLRCFAYRDLKLGKRRLIAYREPCA